ncbi:hypothetical protein [uncultured Prochlorococcus sp.]|jgi:hypothetical protein|uniref:hypothetical protein n=1 Tax=uncultured Prochlorococcus sp. TaxID=159733 RepID=UPI0032B175E6|tara:strand:+ start:118 stop:549 length:432 start_codon:yes stop_codon:yes gene_type:complete
MNINKNENSLKNNLYDANKITSKKIKLFNLKFIHRIFDSVNISLLILIFILSFLSFNSQRKWTSIYKNLLKTRANNNNLIDYISKTEEFYINKIESLNTFKKATPKDLIYLDKQITQNKNNYLNKKIKFIKDGLKDSKYQKGY